MKESITQSVRKEFIYEVYSKTVDNPKEYEKITRKKMIQEVLEYYKEDNHLEECLTCQDILDLKEMIKNGNQIQRQECMHLYQLLLLDFIDYKTKCINQDILPFILERIDSFDLEKAKQRDEKNNLLIGMIKAYGIIKVHNLNQFIMAFNEINGTDLDLKRDVFMNRIVREYYFLAYRDDSKYIVYKIFDDYIEDCLDIQEDETFNVKLFDYESLINIAKYDFDISVTSLKKLYRELQKIDFSYIRERIIRDLIIMLNFGYEYQDIKDSFFSIPFIYSSLTPQLLKYIKNAMDDIPLAIYYGLTQREIEEKEDGQEENLEYLQSVKQNRACLGAKEANRFYKLYMNLLDYVNKKYHIIRENNLARAYHVNPTDQAKIREKLFENLSIIDEYVALNPNRLNSTLLKQVKEMKNAIMMNCVIVKYDNNYTLVMGENETLYGVIGDVCNLDEVIPAHSLPYMCKLVLVPYKGKIVYDGVIEGANIHMGDGFCSMVADAIKDGQIYKSLPIVMN